MSCDSEAPEGAFAQIAKDFGISESYVQRRVKIAEVGDEATPGVSSTEHVEPTKTRKRIRLLEQGNEVLRWAAAYLSQGVLRSPKESTRLSASWSLLAVNDPMRLRLS